MRFRGFRADPLGAFAVRWQLVPGSSPCLPAKFSFRCPARGNPRDVDHRPWLSDAVQASGIDVPGRAARSPSIRDGQRGSVSRRARPRARVESEDSRALPAGGQDPSRARPAAKAGRRAVFRSEPGPRPPSQVSSCAVTRREMIVSQNPIPPDGPGQPAVAGLRREAEHTIQYVLRFWTCEKCTRKNRTEVTHDGIVKCEQCADFTRLESLDQRRPSRLTPEGVRQRFDSP
jgi:hypothetical protein